MTIIQLLRSSGNSPLAQFLTAMTHATPPDSPSRLDNMRKQPLQVRAQQTIETLFQATAQIVEEEGEQALSTNKIAKRAGFSIGTLYQYFPTKESIMLAMIQRARSQMMADLQVRMERAVHDKSDPEAVLREHIHALVVCCGTGGTHAGMGFKRAMIRIAWRMDHHDSIAQSLREGSERIAVALGQMQHPALRPTTPALMFVVTRAVMGAIRSASQEDAAVLGTPEFEEELVRMAWRLLTH